MTKWHNYYAIRNVVILLYLTGLSLIIYLNIQIQFFLNFRFHSFYEYFNSRLARQRSTTQFQILYSYVTLLFNLVVKGLTDELKSSFFRYFNSISKQYISLI